MQSLIVNGAGDFRANYADILTKADNSTNLVDEVDLLLGAGLSAATKASVRQAIDSISMTAANGPSNRVHTAILLTLAAPEFVAQK